MNSVIISIIPLVEEILNSPQAKESDIRKQRARVAELREQLEKT